MYVIMGIALIFAWIINLIQVLGMIYAPITGVFLIKLIGLIPPLQIITVWL